MEIISAAAQAYAEKFSSAEDELLQRLAAYTVAHHPKAHMMSGHLQGRFLEMISSLQQPRRILEIGTFTGYSAICLAKGLRDDGILHTIEVRETDAAIAKTFFDQSFFAKKIKIHIGEAAQIIGELEESWDLVFIDADKENYESYFNLVFPKLSPNGLILADNVLFHGQVLEAEIKGKNAKAIHRFNEFISARTDVEKLLLPLRDGLFLIRKHTGTAR